MKSSLTKVVVVLYAAGIVPALGEELSLNGAVQAAIAESQASAATAQPPSRASTPGVEIPIRLVVSAADDDPRITVPFVRRSDVDIRLDGRLDEAIWHEIDGFDNLRVTKPDTLATPRFKTNMRFFNTERGTYNGVRMEQPTET